MPFSARVNDQNILDKYTDLSLCHNFHKKLVISLELLVWNGTILALAVSVSWKLTIWCLRVIKYYFAIKQGSILVLLLSIIYIWNLIIMNDSLEFPIMLTILLPVLLDDILKFFVNSKITLITKWFPQINNVVNC